MIDLGIDNIVFLGDSLTDNGNYYNLTKQATGIGFPDQPFYAKGCFSNGSVWSDYVGTALGLNNIPFTNFAPFTDQIPQNNQAINFAIGGATSGSKNLGFPPEYPAGLQQQVDALTGLKQTQVFNPSDTLYSLWIGGNDYLSLNLSADNTKKDTKNFVQQTVGQTIGNIKTTLTTLVNQMDAEHIMVFNLPDLSQTPLGLSLKPDAAQTLKSLVTEHNKQLDKEIKSLSKTYTDVDFISIDINALFKDITKKSNPFKFDNLTQAATNTNLYDPQFNPLTHKLTQSPNADNYLFWDSAHPTTKAHGLIADYVIKALESDKNLSKANKAVDLTAQSQIVPSNISNIPAVATSNDSLSVVSNLVTSNPIVLNLNAAGQVQVSSSQQGQVNNKLLGQPVNDLFPTQLQIPIFQLNFANK
ncbi:SGNH/GDSL hydrolase family protein [Gloeothece verrucosa]|uniref:Lipolytic protein G-D-S-L family n=1 Tax=Gloeothece verrucosa (strain PCC 7822) TaxID=497965 RepID=E0UIC7_GLOV7|nr:SGNH/GDSL hydrolase family protein [Gloeothece verrucosa]ADN16895.1 lipolytic protein G-D-S-L family [Gloeothece verrucosa PCC 7822]